MHKAIDILKTLPSLHPVPQFLQPMPCFSKMLHFMVGARLEGWNFEGIYKVPWFRFRSRSRGRHFPHPYPSG